MSEIRVLVCGSRDWDQEGPIRAMLQGMFWEYGPNRDRRMTVIDGGAPGADRYAHAWAVEYETQYPDWVTHLHFDAEWEKYDKSERWRAGHERNQRMLIEGEPTIAFAFKDDADWDSDLKQGGTEHMYKLLKTSQVPVYRIGRQ